MEVIFTDNVDRVQYTIAELIRAANRDVGNAILKIIRKNVRSINRMTAKGKFMPLRYQKWLRKKENDLIIGVENSNQGAVSAWWADQSELGSNGQPKRGFIRSAVYSNIDLIRQIQSKYLSSIEDEEAALRIVRQSEAMDDGLEKDANI